MVKIRCAIYTRKSSEDGLDMDFNTLDAQREAGENYVLSQKHEGWILLPEHYDDGGFSGGNTNRPAFKKLMQDVESGLVDMIVVYKIDRLTRSLIDFSKMVEVFDKNKVSFVSVTLTIDNVSQEIIAYLDLAIDTQDMIELTYRPYLSDNLSCPQMNPPIKLVITDIVADVLKITATARMMDIGNKSFPSENYITKKYPGLTR